ncbi:hypothetical protein NE237_011252 [Protea cynaroides]|uniref:Uncharacterized protein n=1 Tax=Protea cynaroides TaxID=273540 RepID=A0A9Q0JVM8_9MAGN|nr:hypothetical protein NE237_011252 [Protea cynaroides]
MGFEEEREAEEREGGRRRQRSSTIPQKSLLLSIPLPQQSPDHPGMRSPPFRSHASVPFQWEEAPGKPLCPSNTSSSSSSPMEKCLELPPRLQLTESSNNNSKPSPTSVLDGPYVGRSWISPSFRISPPTLGSFRRVTGISDDGDGSLLLGKRRDVSCGRGYFGSFRRMVSPTTSNGSKGIQDVGNSTLVISDSSAAAAAAAVPVGVEPEEVGGGGTTRSKRKITMFRRTGSFSRLPSTKSHLWASIKQVIPWRRRKT